jgi:gluconolactonase
MLASPPQRYPDPAVVVRDPRFASIRLFHAAVERLATGCRWNEGPVWFGDHGCLIWSDIPNDRLLRWDERTGDVSVFRQPSGYANGGTRDLQGRLVSCEHLGRRVTRTEHDGRVTVLADAFDGHRLNAPNDVVVASDGGVWFTDPGYGIDTDYEGRRAAAELPTAVYRVDPATGALDAVVTDLERPNGLCFAPGEALLYVVDSGSSPGRICTYQVGGDGPCRVAAAGTFATLENGTYDGLRCDTSGNVWVAAAGGEGVDGVHVLAADGTLIGQILLPERCANLCFGGAAGNRLFMTASQSVYALFVNATGCGSGQR